MVVVFALCSLTSATTVEQRPSTGGYYEVRATAETDLAPAYLADAFWNARGKAIDAVKKRVVLAHTEHEHLVYQQLAMPVVSASSVVSQARRFARFARTMSA